MSGIVGVVEFDGRPVDRDLLARMTACLAFRGPDASAVWVDDAVGLGHTLARTTDEAAQEHQPFSVDGDLWIVADARVDARRELVAKLAALGCETSLDRPDVELILHAYRTWGASCVEHLLGDFAFAIWDARRRQLFLARDQLGVKPMFYAQLGSTVVFSNTLECVREHPKVSARLNDLAIADFLLFGLNCEKDTSSFADIRRLAPAHVATWTAQGLRLRRYWTLPIEEPIYLRRFDDYPDRFSELLRDAVDDRLRTDRVVVHMSGGMDSTTLAAVARKRLNRRAGHTTLHAFTGLVGPSDEEDRYAEAAASHLGIPLHFQRPLSELLDPDWELTPVRTPEPVAGDASLTVAERRDAMRVAELTRVAFYGEGPDNALCYEWKPYLRYLWGRRAFGRLLLDIGAHIAAHRRVPLLPSLPRMVAARRGGGSPPAAFPEWLRPDLVSRLRLRERWAEIQAETVPIHPVRPRGYRSFDSPRWQLEFVDAAETRTAVEYRHPFVDLRLLRYMLRVPALPWCRSKYLLRRSQRGALPEAVLRRPKSPLLGDPLAARHRASSLRPIKPHPAFLTYVDPARLPSVQPETPQLFWRHMAARNLNYWLFGLD